MADDFPQGKATKPKSGKRQAKALSPPRQEPIPGPSRQSLPKERGHKQSTKGCSDQPKASRSTQCDEHCRDKALEKICAKSSHKQSESHISRKDLALRLRPIETLPKGILLR